MDTDIPATSISSGREKPALQPDCLGSHSGAFHDSLQDPEHICPCSSSDLEISLILPPGQLHLTGKVATLASSSRPCLCTGRAQELNPS